MSFFSSGRDIICPEETRHCSCEEMAANVRESSQESTPGGTTVGIDNVRELKPSKHRTRSHEVNRELKWNAKSSSSRDTIQRNSGFRR